MQRLGHVVHGGDYIPYVICISHQPNQSSPPSQALQSSNSPIVNSDHTNSPPLPSSLAARAYHPLHKPAQASVDVEWYLSKQVLPAVIRLCAHIEETTPSLLSTHLGLESKYGAQKTLMSTQQMTMSEDEMTQSIL